MVYAIVQAPTGEWAATRTLALLALSAVLLAAFVAVEARAQAPLLPLRLFRLSTLVRSNAVGFLLGASFYGYIFIGSLYMQQVLGYSAMNTGLAWLTVGLTGVVLAGPAQLLVNGTSISLVRAAGLTLTGAWILWATQAAAHGSFWANLAGPLFLTGTVTWIFIPVSIGALIGVTERDAGVASGLIDSSQQLGGAIGIAIASTVAATRTRDLHTQGHTITDALTGGFHTPSGSADSSHWPPSPSPSFSSRRTDITQTTTAQATTALQSQVPNQRSSRWTASSKPLNAGPFSTPSPRHCRLNNSTTTRHSSWAG